MAIAVAASSLLSTLLLTLLLSAAPAVLARSAPAAVSAPVTATAEEGQAIFEAKCTGCHTIGQGDLVGPDLKGVTDLRDREWLTAWITAPDELIAKEDPIAMELLSQFNNVPMPNLGLSEAEVASLIDYLATTAGAPPASAPPSAAPLPGGDSVRGRNLYTGVTQLANGGPPCLACHSIAGIGALGGGTLGPDHSTSYERLGDAVITFPQTGTMLPIYGAKPLTPQEEADLLAFFRATTVAERPPQTVWSLAGMAALGLVLLAVIAAVIWRNRLRSVRASMVARATSGYQSIRTDSTEG